MSTELVTTEQTKPSKPLPLFGQLTLRQNSFVNHYLQTGNATLAAKLAGYSGDDTGLAVCGSQLIRSFKIQQEIKRRLGTAIATGDEVLETLTRHARADLTDLLDNNGQLDFKRAKQKRLLKRLKTKTTTRRTKDGEEIEDVTHEYEIHDPQTALEKLGRFHKLFTDRVEVEQPQLATVADELAELRQCVQQIQTSENISLYEAAQRLAQELSDVPELANQLRTWAESELRSKE